MSLSRLEIGIPLASPDGRYYGRYPHGDHPTTQPIAGNASDSSSAAGVLGLTELQDWINRSTGPGVVWAHNFDSASEVNQFRETGGYGIDPTGTGSGNTSTVQWQAGGLAGGGFLRITVPTGGTSNGQWSRPMSAIRSGQPGAGGGTGNGRTVNDPAAGGAVSLNTWDSSAPSTAYNWRRGYYANAQVETDFPFWPDASHTGVYDGTDFYLQFRVRISKSRWSAGNPAGKLIFIDVTDQESDLQELVFRSVNNPDSGISGASWYQTNPLLMYTSRGSYANSIVDGAQDSSYNGAIEPGGPYAATCTYGNAHNAGACWNFLADQWTTLLLHFSPGKDNSNYTGNPPAGAVSGWPYHDTIIEVWKCDPGETAYTKIFEKFDLAWFYYTDPQSSSPNGPNGMYHPPAFNEIAPSGYMNGVPASVGWTQDFTQFIFSHQMIPPPAVNPNTSVAASAAASSSVSASLTTGSGGAGLPAWFSSAAVGQWIAVAGGTGFGSAFQNGPRIQDAASAMGYVPGQSIGASNSGLFAITAAWSGAAVDQSRGLLLIPCGGGHGDYAGNEVYAFYARDSVPGWHQIVAPTPDASLNYNDTPGSSGAVNQDGRPRSMHTGPCWVYGDNRIWLGYQSPYSSPSGGSDAWMWSLNLADSALSAAISAKTPLTWANNVGPWENRGASTVPGGSDPNGAGYYSPAVYDSVNQVAWWASGFGFDRTNTWVWNMHTAGPNIGTGTGWLINGGNGYADFAWAVCCPDLGIIVMGDGSTNQRFIVFEIAHAGGAKGTWYYAPGIDAGAGSVTGSGFYGAINSSFPWAVYQPANHSILIADPSTLGNTIYKLQIPMSAGAYNKAGTWTWSNFVSAGATLLFFESNPFGTVTKDRCMNKFNIINDMGDGATSALVYCGGIGPQNTNAGGVQGAASFNIPTFVMKLPSGGL